MITSSFVDRVAEQVVDSASQGPEAVYTSKDVCPEMVLLIDDDPDVLLILQRELQKLKLTVVATLDAREGVALAKHHKPGVVICDYRMPELNGIEVLQAVCQISPASARVILTGFSDQQAVVSAINQCHVNRYLCKPVDPEFLQLTLLELVATARVKLAQTIAVRELSKRAAELERLNHSLELCIGDSVRESEQAKLFLDLAQREQKSQYLSAVKAFSALTELRSPQLGAHSKRVAEMARLIAIEMGCEYNSVSDIYIAGLLHDVGKIGLSDDALFMPVGNLAKELRNELMTHCTKGEAVFNGLPDMNAISTIIRHHHERYDGEGYPDGIVNHVIPIGSRILAVAEDYDELQQGWLAPKKLSEDEALHFIMKSGDSRYDPEVLKALAPALEKHRAAPRLDERLLSGSELMAGQTLSRDFVGPDGYLWLSKEKTVTKHFIEQVKEYETQHSKTLKVYVHRLKRSSRSTGK